MVSDHHFYRLLSEKVIVFKICLTIKLISIRFQKDLDLTLKVFF